MNKSLRVSGRLWTVSFFLFSIGRALAQEPTATPTLTLDQQQQSLKMEKLELENERLKFQMEKLQFQATQTAVPAYSSGGKAETASKEKETESLKLDSSSKASALAQSGKSQENLLVVDFANAEIWTGGVRYSLYQPESMAEDRHWGIEEQINKIGPDGDRRYLRRLRNLSWLRYEGRKRGIVTFLAPRGTDDFSLVLPEGLSFESGVGDVRNGYPNAYFVLDGERKDGTVRILKFIHRVDLDFPDKLEFGFDKEGKMVKIRYGVLDEH